MAQGKGSLGTNSGKVELAFDHKMSKITLTFVAGNDVDLSKLTSYTLSGIEMSGMFNTATGEAKANTATTTTNTLTISSFTDASDNNGKVSSLILFSQSLSAATLTVTLGGETYKTTVILPTVCSTACLISGYSFNYTCTINKVQMMVSAATINPWSTATSVSGTATMRKVFSRTGNNTVVKLIMQCAACLDIGKTY